MHSSRQTHCKRGHALTPDNLYIYGPTHRQCKTCVKERVQRAYWENPERRAAHKLNAAKWRNNNKEKHRFINLLSEYQITPAEYEAIKLRDNSCCAVCGSKVNIDIDHDHKTGKIRGLLCHKHNTGLGLLGDNVDSLKQFVKYLEDRS